MEIEKPAAGRLRWEQDGAALRLHLGQPPSWPILLGPVIFLLVLLTPNPWSELFIRPVLLGRPSPWGGFGVAFAAVFCLSALLGGLSLGWLLLTSETLTIGQGQVRLTRQLLGRVIFLRRFAVAQVQAVRVAQRDATDPGSRPSTWQGAGFSNGTLRFVLPTETVAFGRGLDPAEARAALRELARRRVLPAALTAPTLGQL